MRTTSMLANRLIERKRDGGRIAEEEWAPLLDAYLRGTVPEYQMAAFLMAVVLRGLDREETAALTRAMLESGAVLDAPATSRPRVDKHSTGGVGDKVSLVLAPLLASLGVDVPMMSGRSLGHTGGTLDKLESIPGFRTDLSLATACAQLDRIGCVLMGQSGEIAPVDRRLYALRDATGTIESVPLIAASIMSKKLAEGLSGLVIDVKRGSGSFLPDLERGLALAHLMVALGHAHDLPVVAIVTAMDRPLGRACGNALEVEESIQALRGEGPADLMRVTYALGAELLVMADVAATRDAAVRLMEVAVSSGRAAEKFAEIIAAQGGDPGVVDDPSLLPQSAECELYAAARNGVIAAIEPRAVGLGVVAMGGGRSRMEDAVDASVGFVIGVRPGDFVRQGEPLATIFARDREGVEAGRAALHSAIRIADEADLPLSLISHRVSTAGAEPYAEEAVPERVLHNES